MPDQFAPPLQQHPSYGAALGSLGVHSKIKAIVDHNGEPVAAYLGVERRFFRLFTVTAIMRGPFFLKDLKSDQRADVYRSIQASAQPWRRSFILQSPDMEDSAYSTGLLKDAGLKRVMSGYSSARLDLSPDLPSLRAGFKGKWRNQLRKAEKSGLEVIVTQKLSSQTARWLISEELKQRQSRRYRALPADFLTAWASQGRSVVVATRHGRTLVAGALFLLHGAAATYHLGLTTEEGRRVNAQNLVLASALEALKKRNITSLDLGGLDTGPLARIGHFKLGTGARAYTLAGTWSR